MNDVVFRSDSAARAVEEQYRRILEQWPVPRIELQLQTFQGSTFVLACGSEHSPPLILLHGSHANSAAWIPDVALWSSRFRVFAVDMIGEAGLSARVRPDLAGDAHARWLDEVFQGLGLSSASIVGTSLGGWLALDYARRRPAAVQALALICPAGIGRQKNFLLKAAPLLLLGAWGKRKMLERVLGPAPKAPTEQMRSLGTLFETIGRAMRPRVVNIPRLTDEQLSQLEMPILTIVGGRDVLLDSADTRARLQRTAAHAEICFIEDGYHYLPDQAPRVLDFLERNAGTRRTAPHSRGCVDRASPKKSS